MRKAPCIHADQSQIQEAHTQAQGAMVIGSEKCLDLLELKYYNDIVELKK